MKGHILFLASTTELNRCEKHQTEKQLHRPKFATTLYTQMGCLSGQWESKSEKKESGLCQAIFIGRNVVNVNLDWRFSWVNQMLYFAWNAPTIRNATVVVYVWIERTREWDGGGWEKGRKEIRMKWFCVYFDRKMGKNPFAFFFLSWISGQIGNSKPNDISTLTGKRRYFVCVWKKMFLHISEDKEMSYLGWRLDGLIACVHAWL